MAREGDRCVAEDPGASVALDSDVEEPFPADALSTGPEDAGAQVPDAEADASGLQPADAGNRNDASMDGRVPEDARPALDAPLAPEAGESEAGSPPDAPPDAGDSETGAPQDAAVLDAFSERDALAGDADDSDAAPDAATEDAAADSDAAPDSGIGELCSPADLSTWRSFQASGRLLSTIATCYAQDPRCARGPCNLDVCLREAAGVFGCNACVAEETRCALGACVAECGASDTSDSCRACACREGCVGAGASCAMGPNDICADCDGTTCQNLTLDPTLIMVIVDSTL